MVELCCPVPFVKGVGREICVAESLLLLVLGLVSHEMYPLEPDADAKSHFFSCLGLGGSSEKNIKKL